MTTIENINVWNKAVLLAKDVYTFCETNKYIKNNFGFRDQIQRASISIASNIAEWADRETQREFMRFLYIARGSCSELKTQLYILKELNYIEQNVFSDLSWKLVEVHKMINAFLKKVAKNL